VVVVARTLPARACSACGECLTATAERTRRASRCPRTRWAARASPACASRACITSVCDHLRIIRKLLPHVAQHAEFQLCDRMWWFGFARCLQIHNQADFFAFRQDFVGSLIPEYKATFARYTTTEVTFFSFFPSKYCRFYPFYYIKYWVGVCQNPNFIETLALVDAGIGLGYEAFECCAMKFEAWHQRCKAHSRQGMGKPVGNTHQWHEGLTEKSTKAQDAELQTVGRIPPTRALRERFKVVPKSIFDRRYHQRMLGPTHGSRPSSSIRQYKADVFEKPS